MSDLIAKITIKTLGVQPEAHSIKEQVDLARIYGVARLAKEMVGKMTDSGDVQTSVRFLGEFEAVNLHTGEVFNSAKLYLPKFLEEMLHTAIVADKEQNGVQFAFQVSVKPGKSPVGYVFIAQSLLAPKENNVLADMRKSFPALAAPAKALPKPSAPAKK